ncbi:hypothetical protein DL93DRAFT_2073645 [Clavulina sp. PMI_390]|nr:hypothetical protein DL93DRAFT_2073645 [Clavulina sp. PMI_390]
MSDSGKSSTASEATGTSKSDAKTTNKSDEKPRQPAEELLDSEPANSDELLKQARDFLTSPSVRHQDVAMKRDFLAKKGVSNDDIERLLVETDVCAYLPLLHDWLDYPVVLNSRSRDLLRYRHLLRYHHGPIFLQLLLLSYLSLFNQQLGLWES